MSSGSPNKLRTRVVDAAESALARQGYASAVDVLTGIGWLDPTTLQRWNTPSRPMLRCSASGDEAIERSTERIGFPATYPPAFDSKTATPGI